MGLLARILVFDNWQVQAGAFRSLDKEFGAGQGRDSVFALFYRNTQPDGTANVLV